MYISSTQGSQFSELSKAATGNDNASDSCLAPDSSFWQIASAEKQMPTGYVHGNIPQRTIADRLHLHQMTKVDYKQRNNKEKIFDEIVPFLMSEMSMSQTSVLTHLLPALEFTPYLRKIERGEMVKISDHPSHLQTALLLELTARIKQGHKLNGMCQLVCESSLAKITVNESNQTISIGHNHFTREDLGDETFRELRDRLFPSGNRECKDPITILNHVQKRKAVSMAHWQEILFMVLNIQDSVTRQRITNTLNTKHELSPSAEAECEALTSLIPKLKLTVHPSFSMMKPLFSWLSQHHLKGDKLSSQQLTWLKSMVTNKLYTNLPVMENTGLEKLCIYKELLVSNRETETPREQQVKKAIDDTLPQQLTGVVELFDTLLCDLTPSVNAENRLGIIYTLLKFRDQCLLKNLLATQSIGRDVLFAMYKTQLILTYSLDEQTPAEVKKEKEQSVNCLLKTLQLRMARCIIIIASKDGLSVSSDIMNKAQTLINHHNEALQAVLPDHDLHQQDADDDSDDGSLSVHSFDGYSDYSDDSMPATNNAISAEDYLAVPDHMLTNGRTITLDPQHLMLPQDKHFRIPSLKINGKNADRRENRCAQDEKKLRADFLLSSRSADLTQPVDWIKMDVPITFLLTKSAQDKNKISFVWQFFNNEVSPVIQQAIGENAIEEQQVMDIVRELLTLAESTGRPRIDLRTIIASIQDRTLNRSLHSLLQQMATALPTLPSNHDRKQLLELTAFQLFAEINPSDRQFKRLIKMLYIIQSRSEHLRFADDRFGLFANSETNQLKLELGRLIRREWSQPDGLLGSRIRQSVKAAFKNSDKGCSYQQVMDSILQSMRPSDQPSDNYSKLIHQASLEVETAINQQKERVNLQQQLDILSSHHKPTYKKYLGDKVKVLIQSASELCKQLLQEACVDKAAETLSDIVSPISDTAMSDQTNRTRDNTLPLDHYSYDQLKALISLIGAWLNQINDDCLISEEDAIKAGIEILEQFANSTVWVSQNHLLQNEDEIVAQIIALCDSFHCLQIEHGQWQFNDEIVSTHNQYVEIKNTLRELEYLYPLDPSQLQKQIKEEMSGSEIHKFSPEGQQLLDTVSALRTKGTEVEVARKALSHPNINEFHRSPEQLSRRITAMNSIWNDSTQALHQQHQLLERTLTQLKRTPLYLGFEAKKKLDQIRQRHDREMANLQSIQQKCERHPLQELSYSHEQSLLSIFESMERSHTAKHSGIELKPLSEQQKQQLKVAIESAPLSNILSDNASLFDWIGMEKTRQQRKQRRASDFDLMSIDRSITGDLDVGLKWKLHATKNAEDIATLQQKIKAENKTLDEMNEAHADRVKSLKKCNEDLFSLLGDKVHAEIVIDDQTYSYVNALIGFKYKNGFYSNDLNSTQKKAADKLNNATWARTRNREINQKNMQWLTFAKECQSRRINPEILPEVIELMALERREQIGDIESRIVDLQQQIQTAEAIIAENSVKVEAAARELEASLKLKLEAQAQKTKAAEQALFSKAFEHGHQLSESRAIQRVLCQYLRENSDAARVKGNILEDCKVMKKHIPSNYADIIEPSFSNTSGSKWQSPGNLPFQVINVPGAFPLLESLHKDGRISPWQLLRYDAEGKPSSALIFAAAKGRYRVCEILVKCLEEQKYLNLATLNQLLTASSSIDNRNLLHHIAQLTKPALLNDLLQLLNNVSKKQDFDADYPSDCLENRVALDKEYLLKMLLTQGDWEGLYPSDLLLFNIAKRIREWPEGKERALTSFCNDFQINEAKSMWIIASESLSVERLGKSIDCFMKGIHDFDLLSPVKRQAAETFLKHLMRIFRVHGPDKQNEQLMARLTPSIEERDLADPLTKKLKLTNLP